MLIEQKFVINAPAERVWAFLMNPDASGPCVPGCEEVRVLDEKTYLAKVNVKIAFVSLAFNVKVTITKMNPPFHLETIATGEERSMTSTLKATSVVDLKGLPEGGTEVSYRSDVGLFGKLGTMGQGVVKGRAKQLGKEFAEAVTRACESVAGGLEGRSVEERATISKGAVQAKVVGGRRSLVGYITGKLRYMWRAVRGWRSLMGRHA